MTRTTRLLALGLAMSAATALSAPARAATYNAGGFTFTLYDTNQTMQSLAPNSDTTFSFTQTDSQFSRTASGNNHLGDIHLRLRTNGSPWRDYASQIPKGAITPLAPGGTVLAAADITAELGTGLPITVQRSWLEVDGVLTLRFDITNTSAHTVEIGVLGMPMVFANVFWNRTIEQNNALSDLAEPYIGRDGGYLQVSRLSGGGPALLVLPEKGTPFNAYEPILNDNGTGYAFSDKDTISNFFEGYYDWTVATLGFKEAEWQGSGTQWNQPATIMLAPKQTRSYGLRLVQSPSIRAVNDTLAAQARPVTVAVPGYVVPTDMDASLYVNAPQAIASAVTEPAGAMSIVPMPKVGAYSRFAVHGVKWGRCRLVLTYADGQVQTVPYFVTKPLEQVNANLGSFITKNQWFNNGGDPFGRSPAILTYDDQAKAIVTQDPRVWVAGMSDEGGAGSYVADAMKQLDNPVPAEVARLEQLVTTTIANTLQIPSGPQIGAVRKSLFFYQPGAVSYPYSPNINWSGWSSWNKAAGYDAVDRGYDYPHVTIAYWTLYRLARNHTNLVTRQTWQWYLQHAYQTVVGMMQNANYTQFGLMEGSVFKSLLLDLKSEPGFETQAQTVEGLMKTRANLWSTQAAPYGSEAPWDATGQEEVYTWEKYFGYAQQARAALDTILGFDPGVPGWGYNGNVHRYWDFGTAGKIQGYERQIYHYAATLNAIPLFDSFRANPADTYLLRVAYGGLLGGITNINQKGFGSTAFHSSPQLMMWDPFTGDYGMGYYGHAASAATYVIEDPALGWLAYGGNVTSGSSPLMVVVPKDGARTRLYVGPANIWIELQAGKIASAEYAKGSKTVTLTLDPATPITPKARVYVSDPANPSQTLTVRGGTFERGGYTVTLGSGGTTVQVASGS